MIVGEAEVQGQVKRAYEAALTARTTGPMTNKLFRAALATGKRVRTETKIGKGRASVASSYVQHRGNIPLSATALGDPDLQEDDDPLDQDGWRAVLVEVWYN